MNLAEYEKIEGNPFHRERIAQAVFYAMGRAQDPYFAAMWSKVPAEKKAAAAEIGLKAVYALVDDYTTPGCECKYCPWKGKSNEGRLIMCSRRWEGLPPEVRAQIAESVRD